MTTRPIDLEPCPFCDAPAHLEEDVPPRAGFKVHAACGPDCVVQPSVWAEYADEARTAWNRRSSPSAEWRLIKDAPKDGKPILLAQDPAGDAGRIHWRYGVGRYSEFAPGKALLWDWPWGGNPTHWKPLEPPK